jgi:TonB family protein
MIPLLLSLLLAGPAAAGELTLDEDDALERTPQDALAAALWPQATTLFTLTREVSFVWTPEEAPEKLPFDEIIRYERARTFEGVPDELFLLLADGRRVLLSRGADVNAQAALLPTLTGFTLKDLPAGQGHSPTEGPITPQLTINSGLSSLKLVGLKGTQLGTPKPVEAPKAEAELQSDPDFAGQGGGTLDKRQIDEVIKVRMGRIQACYQREFQRNPGLQGRVTLRILIDKDGSVPLVKVRQSTMNNPTVEQCLIDELRETHFPAPTGGTVVVTYPFSFSGG